MKRIWIILIAIVVLGIAGFLAYRFWLAPSPQATETPGQIIAVERGSIKATVNATGAIQPKRQIVLTFKSAGRIQKINVKKGQTARQGEKLAELETDEIRLQVRQAEVALQIAEERARLTRRKATTEDLAAAEAGLKSARENLARIKQGPSERQLAAAAASLQAAEANYDKLLAGPTAENLRKARLAIDQAKNSLWGSQNARDSLGLTVQAGGPRSQYDQAQAQVLNAEIAVELAEISFRELQKGADQAQIQGLLAQLEQARDAYQTLKDSPRSSDMALAESQVAQAEATLAKLRSGASQEEIKIADAQVEQARLSLEQARLALAGATITAPFDGVAASVNGEEGALVTAATPLITLLDLSAFRIEANVDEVDIASIAEGQPVVLTLDALAEQKIMGHVSSIAPLASSDAGIVSYAVAIDVAATQAPLRAGMSANAEITTQSKDNVPIIPNRAIRIDRGNATFHAEKWVEGKIVDVEITLGLRNESMSEVVAGLVEGDQLIIRSASLRQQIQESFGGMPGGQ